MTALAGAQRRPRRRRELPLTARCSDWSMARYQDVLDRADTHFRRVLDEQPGAMQCRLGCTLCCQGLFEISAADLVVLMEGLRQLGREALVDLVRKSLGSIEGWTTPTCRIWTRPENGSSSTDLQPSNRVRRSPRRVRARSTLIVLCFAAPSACP